MPPIALRKPGCEPRDPPNAGLAALLAGCFGRRRWRVDDLGAGPGPGSRSPASTSDTNECRNPTGFGDLPEHLLEHVFRNVAGSRRQYHFAM